MSYWITVCDRSDINFNKCTRLIDAFQGKLDEDRLLKFGLSNPRVIITTIRALVDLNLQVTRRITNLSFVFMWKGCSIMPVAIISRIRTTKK